MLSFEAFIYAQAVIIFQINANSSLHCSGPGDIPSPPLQILKLYFIIIIIVLHSGIAGLQYRQSIPAVSYRRLLACCPYSAICRPTEGFDLGCAVLSELNCRKSALLTLHYSIADLNTRFFGL